MNKEVLGKFGLASDMHRKVLYFSTTNSLYVTPLIKNSLIQVDIHHRLTLANLFGPKSLVIEQRMNRANRQSSRSQTVFSEKQDCHPLFEYLHTGDSHPEFD